MRLKAPKLVVKMAFSLVKRCVFPQIWGGGPSWGGIGGILLWFCYMFKLKICGVAQSLVLNYFALLSLCATFFALVMCCCSTALKIVVLKIITKVMDLTLPIFVPICPKELDNP